MLTQLSTVKQRLAIVVTDYDGILTNAIKAVSPRFDKECSMHDGHEATPLQIIFRTIMA